MPRYTNTFSAQTPYGQGLNSIAAAMMAGPSRYEVEQMQAATEGQRLQNEQAQRTLGANESIADVIGQVQMAGEQTAGFVDPSEDQGLQTVVGGVPVAAAKYGAQAGGLTPDMSRTVYAAMAPYADEDALRRMMPVLGHVPGVNTALTTGRADDVRTMQTDEAIRAENAQPMTVFDPDSPTKGRVVTQGDAISEAMYALPKGHHGGGGSAPKPLDIPPKEYGDFAGILDTVTGGARFEPQQEQKIMSLAERYYTAPDSPLRGQPTAAMQQAIDDLSRGAGFTVDEGFWPWIDDTAMIPEAPATGTIVREPMNALPPAEAHKGRIIRDTETGERLMSNGVEWVPAGA